MEELDIEIETQELKRYDLQGSIHKPFNYGRSPGNEEFLALGKVVTELHKIEYALDVLNEIKTSIISNSEKRG